MKRPKPIDRVLLAFGGLTRTANAIGAPISTVQSWQKAGAIPAWRRRDIEHAAQDAGVTLPADFDSCFPKRRAA